MKAGEVGGSVAIIFFFYKMEVGHMPSIVVKPKSSGVGWRVMRQTYTAGARAEVTVPVSEYAMLGLDELMSREVAAARASEVNAAETLRLKSLPKAQVPAEPIIDAVLLPPSLVASFEKWLDDNTNGSAAHIEKLGMQWRTAQRAIVELGLYPSDYADNRKRIYKHYAAKRFSVSYVNCLIRLMNQWGRYVNKRLGLPFEQIANPTGQSREKIAEANEDSKFYRAGGSAPLTPELLKQLKLCLEPCQYNWLFVSFWFGLRPSEVDKIRNTAMARIGETSLHVYQPKLVGLPRHLRWKEIPFVEPEQFEAAKLLTTGNFKRPLSKTLKRHTGIDQISCYAGRKGFVDVMLGRGRTFYDISMWMGHQSVDRTWKNYKQRVGLVESPSLAPTN